MGLPAPKPAGQRVRIVTDPELVQNLGADQAFIDLMTYSYTLWDSIGQTNLEDWNRLRSPGDGPFMDPRFVATVQQAMAEEGRFWNLIIYDSKKQPVATACLSLLRIDGGILTKGLVKRVITGLRRVWSSYLYFKVLFVGLPVSAGQSHLLIRPDADAAELLRTLDAVLLELAARHRASLIVLKEFTSEEVERLDGLRKYGYRRADSLPMNHFEPRFANFDDYCAALRKTFRKSIRYSLRKYEEAGLRTVQLSGREGAKLYTDQMHGLYEAVLERAHSRLERLPAEFFRELGRRFEDQAVFFALYRAERVIGCAWTLLIEPVFYMLFAGMDYELNRELDLYFNLTYRQLDYGMRQGVSDIRVGQTADEFRARLGCRQEPRYLYIKGRGLLSLLLAMFSGMVFAPVKLTPSHVVLREDGAEADRVTDEGRGARDEG